MSWAGRKKCGKLTSLLQAIIVLSFLYRPYLLKGGDWDQWTSSLFEPGVCCGVWYRLEEQRKKRRRRLQIEISDPDVLCLQDACSHCCCVCYTRWLLLYRQWTGHIKGHITVSLSDSVTTHSSFSAITCCLSCFWLNLCLFFVSSFIMDP